MNGDPHQATFEKTIAGASPEVRKLAQGLRKLIHSIHPVVVEVAWPRQGIVGFGVGPKKMSEHYCYISIQKTHANLGFYYGTRLPAPSMLVEGTGKLLRHAKVKSEAQASNPHLRRMVGAALEERRRALHLMK